MQETRKIAGDGYYRQLLESIKGKPSPAVKQIELDLLRTLPNNKHYEKLDADGASVLAFPFNSFVPLWNFFPEIVCMFSNWSYSVRLSFGILSQKNKKKP